MKKHDVLANLIWVDLEANWHHGRCPWATILTIGNKDCVHLLLLGHIFWKKKRTFWGILTDQGRYDSEVWHEELQNWENWSRLLITSQKPVFQTGIQKVHHLEGASPWRSNNKTLPITLIFNSKIHVIHCRFSKQNNRCMNHFFLPQHQTSSWYINSMHQ